MFSTVNTMVMAATFGVIFALPYIGTFLKTKEREQYMHEPKRKGNIFKELFETMKVKSFRKLTYMYLCSFLALDVITTLFMFFMRYYLNKNDMGNLVLDAKRDGVQLDEALKNEVEGWKGTLL